VVHPADIQDRDGGVLVLSTLSGLYPFLQKLFADGGYQCKSRSNNPSLKRPIGSAAPESNCGI